VMNHLRQVAFDRDEKMAKLAAKNALEEIAPEVVAEEEAPVVAEGA